MNGNGTERLVSAGVRPFVLTGVPGRGSSSYPKAPRGAGFN